MHAKHFMAVFMCLMLLASSATALADAGAEVLPAGQVGDTLAYEPREPITIEENIDLTQGSNGITNWKTGNGTAENPWIIEGWEIDGSSGYAISVSNTDQHFIIRNCRFYDSNAYAVYFNNVRNGVIDDCTFEDNFEDGMYIMNSRDNVIKNNVFSHYDYAASAITLEGSSDNQILNNTFALDVAFIEYLESVIYLTAGSSFNIIEDNVISGGYYGIYIRLTSNNNIVRRNEIHENGDYGLFIEANNNRIYHNWFRDNDIAHASNEGINFWNATYPIGGNYWEDYALTATDVWVGPHPQNTGIPGSDGIADTPYDSIDGSGSRVDYYPLMTPDFVPLAIDSIVIQNGTGADIIDMTVPVGFTLTGYAAAYNSTTGYFFGHVVADWAVANTPGTAAFTSPGVGTNSTFNAGITGGTAEWTAEYEGVACSVTFTVTAPTVDYIRIRTAPDEGGTDITDTPLNVGRYITGYAASYNISAGYLGDVTANWTVANSSGASASTSPDEGTSSTFHSGRTGGTAVWTANYSDILRIVTFNVNPPVVNTLRIRTEPDGGGINMATTATVNVGHTRTGYAAGFNNTIGYVGDLDVTWTVANSSGATALTGPASGTNSTFNAGLTGGTAVWTANYLGVTRSVTFSIREPTVNHIEIHDTVGGKGSAIAPNIVLNVSDTVNGFAASFNDTADYIGDVPVKWTVTNTGSSSTTSHATGKFSTFNAGTKGGTAVWKADYGGKTYSVTFTITPPDIDYVQIRTAAGGIGTVMADATLTANSTAKGYAAGYNNTAGYVGDVVASWSTASDGASASTAPASGTASTFNAGTAPGNVTWTASFGGKTFTVRFAVTTGQLHRIAIAPTTATLTAVETAQFTATGYDEFDNALPHVAISWSTTDPAAMATGGLFRAHTAGTWLVTATSASVKASATVTVTLGPLAGITLSPGAVTITADESVQFTATGLDARGNTIAGAAFTWQTSDTQASVANGLFAANRAGTWSVTASSASISSLDALVIVKPGAMTGITVTPTGQSIQAGTGLQFNAVGLDSKGNEIEDLQYAWTSSDTSAAMSSTGMFAARAAGTWTITARHGALTGTATVTVTPGPASTVSISLPVTSSRTVRVGQTLDFSAIAYDRNGNPITSDITWTTNDPDGAVVAGVYTAGSTGTWVVRVTVDGVTSVFNVNVAGETAAQKSAGGIAIWTLIIVAIVVLALLLLMRMGLLGGGDRPSGTGAPPEDMLDSEPAQESMIPEEELPPEEMADAEPIAAEELPAEAESEELPAAEPEAVPSEAEMPAAEPEDPRIAKLRDAYEAGKISKELYEKNLAKFQGK